LSNPDNDSGYIIGITPVFHYQPKNYRYTPFIEMGGGPHLLSDITIENDYKSTQFQFGSIFGLGVKNQDFEISYRYLHISNAGIEMPNPGTDFHNIHVGYYF
nr:acyloxyacyl hydrolase [Thiomicrorhabdus sp.]